MARHDLHRRSLSFICAAAFCLVTTRAKAETPPSEAPIYPILKEINLRAGAEDFGSKATLKIYLDAGTYEVTSVPWSTSYSTGTLRISIPDLRASTMDGSGIEVVIPEAPTASSEIPLERLWIADGKKIVVHYRGQNSEFCVRKHRRHFHLDSLVESTTRLDFRPLSPPHNSARAIVHPFNVGPDRRQWCSQALPTLREFVRREGWIPIDEYDNEYECAVFLYPGANHCMIYVIDPTGKRPNFKTLGFLPGNHKVQLR